MNNFKNIGLFIKKIEPNSVESPTSSKIGIKAAVEKVLKILQQHNCNIYSEKECLKKSCDLIIVIGGDGSLLHAARTIIDTNTPILGIHKGRLGFLADLNFNKIKSSLTAILSGKYIEEQRSLLYTSIKQKNKPKNITNCAVNDVVLYSGKIPRLIEFEIFIDDQFILQLRADGLIIATPTGSTAYSLSAGGPILYPTLKIFNIIPMYPHTLNSRPLVVNETSLIKLKILDHHNNADCGLSFDGQNYIKLTKGTEINITKYHKELKLIHPLKYNYFTMLREKLGWNKLK